MKQNKRAIIGLKNKLKSWANLHKIDALNNELKDAERVKIQLENDIRVLQRKAGYQGKAIGKLTGEVDYEGKLSSLAEELEWLKEEHKELEREQKEKEARNLEYHKNLLDVEKENIRLKRLLISLK